MHSTLRLTAVTLAVALTLAACGADSAADLIRSGQEFQAKGEVAKAVIQFKSALQQEPNSPEARYLLGQALLANGDPINAQLELAKAYDQRYDENKVLPALARAMLLSGGAKKLTTLYGAVSLKDKTANADLKATLANAYGVLGDRERAIALLAEGAASQPDHPAVLVLQARVEASKNQTDAAFATIDKVLASSPKYYEAWHFKGELLTHVKKDLPAANAAYQKSLELEPANVATHLALINNHLRANDLPAAVAQSKKMHAAQPKHPQTVYVTAMLALVGKDYKRARELAQALLRVAPENTGVLQLAGASEAGLGALLQAEAHLNKALQQNAELPLARRTLARVYLNMGQPGKAIATLQPLTTASSTDTEALGMAGEAQLQVGDTRAAEQLFVQAAKLNPKDIKPRSALALLQLSRGETATGFAMLEAASAESNDTTADLALFSERLRRKDYASALKALDTIEKKRPKDAVVHELRGLLYLNKGDLAQAAKAYEAALALDPTRFSATARLAEMEIKQGQFDAAAKRLTAAIETSPRNHTARLALANLRLQQGAPLPEVRELMASGIAAAPNEAEPRARLVDLLLQRKLFKDAVTVAQEAVAALPNDNDVLDALGRAQVLSGDLQQAISTFRKLSAAETRKTEPHIKLAELLRKSGDQDGAVSSLRKALDIDAGDETAQAMMMDIQAANGKLQDALAMARAMQTRAPQAASGYMLEASLHKRNKNPEAALQAYRTGLKAATKKTELAVGLHGTLFSMNKLAEAEAFSTAWRKDNPGDAGFDNHLASTLILRTEYARAEQLLLGVVAARPNHVTALNNLSWVLTAQGKPGAVAHAQRATEIQPNRPPLMDTLALALAGEKQYPKAIEVQRKAIEIAPGDMNLRLGLAKILLASGDKAAAKTELDKLAALGTKLPSHAEVSRLLKQI